MKPYRDLYPHTGLMLTNTKVVADRVLLLPTGTAVTAQTVEAIGHIIRKSLLP